MAFESYVRHISQKYRLAIALAVLREKPESISIEQYLKQLRDKINSDNVDDLDITICSDDFDIDNESNNDTEKSHENNTILEAGLFNDNTSNDKHKEIENPKSNTQDSINLLEGYIVNDTQIDNTQINDEFANKIEDSTTTLNDVHKYSKDMTQESISLLKDVAINEKDNPEKFKTNIILAEEKNIDIEMEDNRHYRYITRIIDNQANINVQNNDKMDVTYCDSDLTNNFTNIYIHDVLASTHKEISNPEECKNDIQDNSQNYTHVSQSQYNNIVINQNLIKSKSKDAQSGLNGKNKVSKNSDVKESQNDNSKSDSNEKNKDIEINKDNFEVNRAFAQHSQDSNNILATEQIDSQHNTQTNDCNEENNGHIGTTKSQELIPFKVIEELNKVKNYLNRRDERRCSNDGSVDSGYKTDSQNKSLKSSLQAGNWLNQSAHSLLDYLMDSPGVIATQEITNEISKVLAQLVDRLHEEEKYLSFLDELLDIVDNLIQEILGGDNCDENILLKKDRTVNRVLLLNRSSHIQKYTIEKLTTTLESIYTHISDPEETYEITNISNIENLSYIFHVLEIILQRYVESKKLVKDENPSCSQGELKKSSIINIWRKKWYPNFKENEGSEEVVRKKCVLLKCNEVLNKIVVNCMDGYSLLCFAALQCFNLLQS